MSEWKSGDMGLNLTWGYRGIFVANCRQHGGVDHWHNQSGLTDPAGDRRRPLVVLDPEDREQMDLVAKTLVEKMHRAGDVASAANGVHPATLVATFRQLANPTPRIEEPTGLGAVVEDEDGDNHVKVALGPHGWVLANAMTRIDSGYGGRSWRDLNAIRVLSPGVEVSQ